MVPKIRLTPLKFPLLVNLIINFTKNSLETLQELYFDGSLNTGDNFGRPPLMKCSISERIWWNVPKCTPNFTSRTAQIQTVRSKINNATRHAPQLTILFTGPAGIGKNEVIRKVATNQYGEHGWNVLGIGKDFEIPAKNLGKTLGLDIEHAEISPEMLIVEIVVAMQSRAPTIVVIDGSSDTSGLPREKILQLLKIFNDLPPSENTLVFLISSRQFGGYEGMFPTNIELTPFLEFETANILSAIPLNMNQRALSDLHKLSGGRPSDVFKTVQILQGYYNVKVQGYDSFTFNRVMHILTYCAHIISTNYAYLLCQKFCPNLTTATFLSIVNRALANGFCGTANAETAVGMLDFTKQVLRTYIKYADDFDPEPIELRKLLSLLLELFNSKKDYGTDAMHLGSVWSFAVEYDELIRDFPMTPYRIVTEATKDRVLNQAFLEKNFNRLREINGFSDQWTLKIGSQYAEFLYMIKKKEESLALFSELFQRMKTTLGLANSITITTGHWYAWILCEFGKYDLLIPLHSELRTCCQAACEPLGR